MRASVIAAIAVLLATSLPCPGWTQQPAQAPAALPVGVVAVDKQPITKGAEFVGRIEAMQRVEIRARVTGYLEDVLFKDGQPVKAGEPLYRIEKGPFQAALQQAQGALLQAQGTLANASVQRARAEELVKSSATSVATRDERVAAEENAKGAVVRAEADLKLAAINLAYTEISAPIAGRIGRTAVTQGNVVSPSGGVLATIVSQGRVYVTFAVSQREFMREQETKKKANADSLTVKLRFSTGLIFKHEGKIDFVDVAVDRTTDTVIVRAVVDDPDNELVDGEYANVIVQGDTPEMQVVVPQAALIADQAGIYVFVVENGKAAVRRLKLGGEVGPNVAVESGLNPGDQVVVEGLQALRPGMAVTAAPARLSVQGG